MPASPARLFLVDDDPVFRLGLRSALQGFAEVTVVGEAETGADALQQLGIGPTVDLILLEWNLGRGTPGLQAGLEFCQAVQAQYPQLPILLVSTPPTAEVSQLTSVRGYCPKGTAIAQLITAIRRILQGEFYFAADLPRSNSLGLPTPTAPAPVTPLGLLRDSTRLAGLRQIEAAIAQINAELQRGNPSWLDRAVLAGRRRELLASRWLVNRLLAPPGPPVPPTPPVTSGSPDDAGGEQLELPGFSGGVVGCDRCPPPDRPAKPDGYPPGD